MLPKTITGIDKAVAELSAEVIARKNEVLEKLAPYEKPCITEDSMDAWKKDRAGLNKEKKAFNDERIALEKEWKEKILPITTEYKKVDSAYAEAIRNIDAGMQVFENERLEAKRKLISRLFDETVIPEGLEGWVILSEIYNPKWENISTKEKAIRTEIDDYFTSLHMSYTTLKMMGNKYEEEGMKTLKATKDIQKAIARMNDLVEMEKKVEEMRPIKEPEKEPAEAPAKVVEKVERIPDEFVFGMPKPINRYKVVGIIESVMDVDIMEYLKTCGFIEVEACHEI